MTGRHPRAPCVAVLRHHRGEAPATTPAGHAHVMVDDAFVMPDIAFRIAWLGTAALRTTDSHGGKVKSTRTAPAAQRRGVARTLLTHLLAQARANRLRRVSPETGTAPMFAAANAS